MPYNKTETYKIAFRLFSVQIGMFAVSHPDREVEIMKLIVEPGDDKHAYKTAYRQMRTNLRTFGRENTEFQAETIKILNNVSTERPAELRKRSKLLG